MAWRFHGRSFPDASSPTAQGVCDRCSIYYQLSQLKFQYEYRGIGLSNTWFRVCPTCMDKPAAFKKSILLPADPVPVAYPRVSQAQSQMESQQIVVWDEALGTTIILAMWDDGESVWP